MPRHSISSKVITANYFSSHFCSGDTTTCMASWSTLILCILYADSTVAQAALFIETLIEDVNLYTDVSSYSLLFSSFRSLSLQHASINCTTVSQFPINHYNFLTDTQTRIELTEQAMNAVLYSFFVFFARKWQNNLTNDYVSPSTSSVHK